MLELTGLPHLPCDPDNLTAPLCFSVLIVRSWGGSNETGAFTLEILRFPQS